MHKRLEKPTEQRHWPELKCCKWRQRYYIPNTSDAKVYHLSRFIYCTRLSVYKYVHVASAPAAFSKLVAYKTLAISVSFSENLPKNVEDVAFPPFFVLHNLSKCAFWLRCVRNKLAAFMPTVFKDAKVCCIYKNPEFL